MLGGIRVTLERFRGCRLIIFLFLLKYDMVTFESTSNAFLEVSQTIFHASDPSKYKDIIEKSGEEISKSSEKEPQPHLCLRLSHKDSKSRVITHVLNVFSWTKIKEPGKIQSHFHSLEALKPLGKRIQGTFEERDHFVKLVLMFLEGQGHEDINPDNYSWEYIRGKEAIGDVKKTILGFYGLTLPSSPTHVQIHSGKEKDSWIKPRERRRLKKREDFVIGKCFYRRNGEEFPVAVEYRVYLPDIESCEDILLQIEGADVCLMTTRGQQERLKDIQVLL
ncbi:unnamed protein product [Lepeophtheirus salmonis]|uniref:(salmon louse) hypothetical protein n=1 Tax=Lepeophtheirus salmonis TaxID=72036 RepID=A0A7R8CRT9_LEPSM|nr:unnamed protein product [Lepeophtheirus salmonis]CAF2859326.1 unnamed protein product [Lepeophtheirus salmonis]